MTAAAMDQHDSDELGQKLAAAAMEQQSMATPRAHQFFLVDVSEEMVNAMLEGKPNGAFYIWEKADEEDSELCTFVLHYRHNGSTHMVDLINDGDGVGISGSKWRFGRVLDVVQFYSDQDKELEDLPCHLLYSSSLVHDYSRQLALGDPWTVSDVSKWLASQDFGPEQEVFLQHGIDGVALLELEDSDLLRMRIHDPNRRLALLEATDLLRASLLEGNDLPPLPLHKTYKFVQDEDRFRIIDAQTQEEVQNMTGLMAQFAGNFMEEQQRQQQRQQRAAAPQRAQFRSVPPQPPHTAGPGFAAAHHKPGPSDLQHPGASTWPWNQEHSSATKALSILDGFGNGAFVIRPGETKRSRILSYVYNGTIYDEHILPNDDPPGFYLEKNPELLFYNLEEVVIYLRVPRPELPAPLVFYDYDNTHGPARARVEQVHGGTRMFNATSTATAGVRRAHRQQGPPSIYGSRRGIYQTRSAASQGYARSQPRSHPLYHHHEHHERLVRMRPQQQVHGGAARTVRFARGSPNRALRPGYGPRAVASPRAATAGRGGMVRRRGRGAPGQELTLESQHYVAEEIRKEQRSPRRVLPARGHSAAARAHSLQAGPGRAPLPRHESLSAQAMADHNSMAARTRTQVSSRHSTSDGRRPSHHSARPPPIPLSPRPSQSAMSPVHDGARVEPEAADGDGDDIRPADGARQASVRSGASAGTDRGSSGKSNRSTTSALDPRKFNIHQDKLKDEALALLGKSEGSFVIYHHEGCAGEMAVRRGDGEITYKQINKNSDGVRLQNSKEVHDSLFKLIQYYTAQRTDLPCPLKLEE